MASINSFIINLDNIDYLILNQSANKNLAPYRLIKKVAENERTLIRQTHSQVLSKHFIHCMSGQFILKLDFNHSTPSQSKNQSKSSFSQQIQKFANGGQTDEKKLSIMKNRSNLNGFEAGFISRDQISTDRWHGESDREESISDPRWHK